MYYCFNHKKLLESTSNHAWISAEVTKAQIGPGGLDAKTPIPRKLQLVMGVAPLLDGFFEGKFQSEMDDLGIPP